MLAPSFFWRLASSARRKKRKRASLKFCAEIAVKNKVRYVLTGSYQVLGKKIRITSQLDDAFKKNIIWSGKFDNEIDNMFEILDDISGRIFK